MARKLALVALVIAVTQTTVPRADAQDEGSGMATGADLTGVDGSDQAVVPADVVPDPTVGSSRGQQADGVWDRLAACESNQRWDIVDPPYYGGLQEDLVFWRRYGGTTFASRPDLATKNEQIVIAERGLAVQGPGAWPVCSRVVGLR
jgi:hypothetical protein